MDIGINCPTKLATLLTGTFLCSLTDSNKEIIAYLALEILLSGMTIVPCHESKDTPKNSKTCTGAQINFVAFGTNPFKKKYHFSSFVPISLFVENIDRTQSLYLKHSSLILFTLPFRCKRHAKLSINIAC